VFKTKVNVRILQIALPPGGPTAWDQGRNFMDAKRVGSGLLLQTSDIHELKLSDLKVVTKVQPTEQQLQDLLFAWKVATYVKSNAIVFCANGMTFGVGAGQMSRLDSAPRPPGCRWQAQRWPAMRSSPSAMAWMWWWTQVLPASSSPVAACATRK
jgi:AICAR transformylase/IMP cyclohydrolase PurH